MFRQLEHDNTYQQSSKMEEMSSAADLFGAINLAQVLVEEDVIP
jgi:hypothetical protein